MGRGRRTHSRETTLGQEERNPETEREVSIFKIKQEIIPTARNNKTSSLVQWDVTTSINNPAGY